MSILLAVQLLAYVFAVEIRNLRPATLLVALGSLVLVVTLAVFGLTSDHANLLTWAVTSLVFKVFLIPWLILMMLRRMPADEAKPLLPFLASVIVMVVLVGASFRFASAYLGAQLANVLPVIQGQRAWPDAALILPFGFAMFVLGLYCLLAKRDTIKAVLGLVIMENGVHLVLLSLAPTLNEVTEIGMALNLVVAAGLLAYLASSIYREFSTTDSTTLSELKW